MSTKNPGAKSLIVGAAGQVGHALNRELGPAKTLPTSRKANGPQWLVMDLENIAERADEIQKKLEPLELDAIYCVGGMTDVEGCESQLERAMRINSSGPATLAKLACQRKIPCVYFSTEYVFDGCHGPYTEADEPHPISVYGKSKLAGERAVLDACSHALIIRTTVVYGPDPGGKNFLYSLRRAILKERRIFRVPSDQISTPTFNQDLARATVGLVRAGATGIYHVCGPELLSRLDFALAAAKVFSLDISNIVGVRTAELGQRAPRPLNAGLRIDKLIKQHPELKMRPLQEALKNWLQTGELLDD